MRVRVLGVDGPYPRAGSACSGYLFEEGPERILVDCGPGVAANLAGVCRVTELSAVILTHLHWDHISDFLALRYQAIVHGGGRPVPVYAPPQPDAIYGFLEYRGFALRALAGEPVEIGPFSLAFEPNRHKVPAYAVRVQAGHDTVVYSSDTSYHQGLVRLASGADTLLCEGSLRDEEKARAAGHLTPAQAGRIARLSGVRRMVLVHLPPEADREACRREAEESAGIPVITGEIGISWDEPEAAAGKSTAGAN